MNQFDIIIDTREQTGWEFTHCDEVDGLIHSKLDTGDYSVSGLEDKLCIERKSSVGELAGSIVQKRFMKEIERMAQIAHAFLILEFGISDILDYPAGSNIPKKMWDKIKVKGPFILGFLDKIQLDYNVHVLFCGNRDNAEQTAYRLMKKCHKRHIQSKN